MTEFSEWAAKMNKDFKSIDDDSTKSKALFTSPILDIQTPIITFSIKSRLLPKHQRLIATMKKASDETDYDTIQDVISTILADLCTDKQYDKEFWVSLDEETGYLPDVFAKVSEVIAESQKAGVNFRTV